jgi:hypothetical protein
MNRRAVRVAMAAVRGWTHLYTWGLEKHAREARRDEIESDLWESAHDGDTEPETLALCVWTRLLGGLVDDVRWRAAQVTGTELYAWRVGTTFALAILIGLWIVKAATLPVGRPRPPLPPKIDVRPMSMRQPPPPPPPPCLPESFKQDPGVPCIR